MVAGIVGQMHRDTLSWLTRVKAANGSVLGNIQVAINEFVSWHYKSKLRDTNNIDHKVGSCSVFATENLNGVFEKLWFFSGEPSALTATNPTYTKNDGVSFNQQNSISLGLNSSNLISTNLHFGAYANNDTVIADGLGAVVSANNIFTFLALELNYDGSSFFLVGESNKTGYSVDLVLQNKKGLILGIQDFTKKYLFGNNNTQSANVAIAPDLSLPSNQTLVFPRYLDSSSTELRKIGGYSIGKTIPSALIADFYTAWNKVQAQISSSRVFYV